LVNLPIVYSLLGWMRRDKLTLLATQRHSHQ
jgi:hypothetical protein